MNRIASWLDVKLGLRMLIKFPALTIVGGLGLAVGVAISVGFFAVLYAYVAPTLPLEEGERIVALENRDIEVNNEDRRALHDFVEWREELRTVVDLGAFRRVSRNLIAGEGSPALVDVAEMTASGFTLARVAPRLGRTLVAADERAGAPAVVVIGHDVWEARFGADPGVLGRDVRLGSRVHTIVGVMPDGFGFPMNDQFWTPLKLDPTAHARRTGPEIFIFGRLAPDATAEQAQAELTVLGQRAAAAYPETHENLRPMVMPYTHSLTDIQGATFWEFSLMQFTMTLVLLIVAVNVGVLFYARTALRRGEIALRSALGASRGRVVAQLFVEALVLSAAGSAFGLLLAQVGIRFGFEVMRSEFGGTPFWADYSLQPMTLLFTVSLAVLAAVIVGVVPGLQATGRGLQSDLRQLGGSTGLRLGRTWTALIVAQVAIAVALLPVVVGMVWSDVSEWTMRATYPAEAFLVAGLWTDPEEPLDAPFGEQLADLMGRLEREPAVAGVTFRASLPGRGERIIVDGMPAPAGSASGHTVQIVGGGSNLLDVFGPSVLAGRAFQPGDDHPDADAVVVSRSFVRRVLGDAPALGRRIRHSPEAGDASAQPERWYRIVGVVEDLVANSLRPDTVPAVLYYAVAPAQVREAQLAVRRHPSADASLATRMRELSVAVDPKLRLGPVQSLADQERMNALAARTMALVVSLVLVSVFLLSAAGIYALMSFTVTQRRREIGIRAALGAAPHHVLRSIFARAGTQIAAGVVLGVGMAALLEIVSGGTMLGGKGAVLLPVFAGTMGVVALLAASGPARRGLRIEPTEALRAEA